MIPIGPKPPHPRAAIITLLACALVLAACASPVRGLFPPKPCEKTEAVWLVDHGWHTGLIVKTSTLPSAARPSWAPLPAKSYPYTEFGWGDAGFYNAKKITLGICAKALLWKNPSVLHVVAMDEPPARYFPSSGLIRITISEAGGRLLGEAIAASYRRDPAGHRIDLGPGLYGESRFYAATGSYYSFNTCNVWTARTLRSTGAPMTPFWSIFARPVFFQASHFGEVIRKP